MAPRPAPDLARRRAGIIDVARAVAAADGWEAVTMRRVAAEIGATQPVIYSAFARGRQEIIDAVALAGFSALADALTAVPDEPLERMRAYLEFAVSRPRVYEAMFSMPSGLEFGSEHTPEPMQRAFDGLRSAFATAGDATVEVAWATVHGLATLEISGRLPSVRAAERLALAHRALCAASS